MNYLIAVGLCAFALGLMVGVFIEYYACGHYLRKEDEGR